MSPYVYLKRSRGLLASQRYERKSQESVTGDAFAPKHLSNGVACSKFAGWAGADRAWCIHTVWSLEVRARPIIFTRLNAASTSCFLYSHHRMPPETLWMELSKSCDTAATSLPVKSVPNQQLMLQLHQMLLRRFKIWLAFCCESVQ